MLTKYFTQQKIYTLAVLCIVAALLLAACGGSTSAPPSSSTPSSSPPASAPSAIPTIPSVTTSITLKHMPSGTADLNSDPSTHALTVKVSLVGLAPSSMPPAHIHTGSC